MLKCQLEQRQWRERVKVTVRTGPIDPRCYAEVPVRTKAAAGEG